MEARREDVKRTVLRERWTVDGLRKISVREGWAEARALVLMADDGWRL